MWEEKRQVTAVLPRERWEDTCPCPREGSAFRLNPSQFGILLTAPFASLFWDGYTNIVRSACISSLAMAAKTWMPLTPRLLQLLGNAQVSPH